MEFPHSIVKEIHTLAWNGQHDAAIERAAQMLSVPDLSPDLLLSLLALRAESYIALGKFDLALQDAQTMQRSAVASHALQAQALNRLAIAHLRRGELKPGLKFAKNALKAARESGEKPALAQTLLTLSEAQWRTAHYKPSIANAKQAITLFHELGDTAGEGRAYWSLASAYMEINRDSDGNRAAQTALALGKQAGDQVGIGNALNLLIFADIAQQLRTYQQAEAAFRNAGYVERRAVVAANLSACYQDLGMYQRALRLQKQARKVFQAVGAHIGWRYTLQQIVFLEIQLGNLEKARRTADELENALRGIGDLYTEGQLHMLRANIAFLSGDAETAIARQKMAVEKFREDGGGWEYLPLSELAAMYLELNDPIRALEANAAAMDVCSAFDVNTFTNSLGQDLWTSRARALLGNHRPEEAQQALERAYEFLLNSIVSIRDVGLRRNALNKVRSNRLLLRYWAAEGQKRGLPHERLFAHLYIESNQREPFQRLADTSQRLNALKTEDEIVTFLVDEATELCGGERVMLILKTGQGLFPAAFSLPLVEWGLGKGGGFAEDPQDVLQRIGEYLDLARQDGETKLLSPNTRPQTADGGQQSAVGGLSRVIAPLIAQNRILGYLYADMDTLYGIFDEIDRDMLGMLASQGAVALENARLVAGLERTVEERTAQLQERARETAALLDISRDISASLEITTVLEGIAAHAKNLFNANLSALFLPADGAFQAVTALGEDAHALINERIAPGEGILGHIAHNKTGEIVNHVAADPRALPITGTDMEQNEHLMAVPLLANDELKGLMAVWRAGDGKEFVWNELEFLNGLARQAVIAIENASLFAEAQRLRDEQRRLIRTFTDKEVAERLMSEGFTLGGKHAVITAMFCDIRNFTALTEANDPADIIDLINQYYGIVINAVQAHGGNANLMIGDGLMSFFGAPVFYADHAQRAMNSALEIQRQLRAYNQQQAQRGGLTIEVGIGIATGRVVAGYAGTETRATYLCLGDPVNLSSRLESHTKVVGRSIVIDEAARAALNDTFAIEPLGEQTFKGKTKPVKIYALHVEP